MNTNHASRITHVTHITQHPAFVGRRLVAHNPQRVRISEIICSPAPFGCWLKERRKALGLSCKELARHVNCPTAVIRKLESGERQPCRRLAELLAARLNAPIEEWESFLRYARRDTHIGSTFDTVHNNCNLLHENERKLFRRLGVFANGCTLEEAKTVCNSEGDLIAESEPELCDLLQSLTNKNLLREYTDDIGEPRYRIPETLREYALRRLWESGEAEAVMLRHVNYVRRLEGWNVMNLLTF